MSKTVEIRIPKEKRIIVCTEGSLENKLYQLGIEQGKLAVLEEFSVWLSTRNEEYTIHGERATEDYNWGLNDFYVRLKSQIKEDGSKEAYEQAKRDEAHRGDDE